MLKIIAKRWFQKTYGNTYHSVKIYEIVNNTEKLIAEKTCTYGYGRHYLQTAAELLNSINYFNAPITYSDLLKMLGNEVIEDVTDVNRKKDL